MKNLFLVLILVFSFSALAEVQLQTGDYGVEVRDRNGNIHRCTLEIENLVAQEMLVLNILDCPPKVIDVELYYYESDGVYMSEKIEVNSRRGGYKLYEIKPMSSMRFEMTSHREYGDGGIGKPRKVIATLK